MKSGYLRLKQSWLRVHYSNLETISTHPYRTIAYNMPFWQQFYNLFHSFYIIGCSFFGIKGLWEGSSTVSDTVLRVH